MLALPTYRVLGALLAVAALHALPSTARAVIFGPPAALTPPGDGGSIDDNPRVATGANGTWLAVWHSNDPSGGAGVDFDVFVARSTDGGATWSAPAPLNANATSDTGGDFGPHLATDGAGTWVALWTSDDSLGGTIDGDVDVLTARSADDGLTWSEPAALNADAAGDCCQDFIGQHHALATDGAGTWVAAWSSQNPDVFYRDFDVVVARSTDGGATWSPPVLVDAGAVGDRFEDEAVTIAVGATGTWIALWRSRDGSFGPARQATLVRFARSTDQGATWSPSEVLSTNAGEHAGGQAPGPYSLELGDPTVATDGSGAWVAAWRFHDPSGDGALGVDLDIVTSRSADDGLTWTAPAPLNTNAAEDSGGDEFPMVASDGAGTWVAVWRSQDTLGGVLGSDFDILFAQSVDGGTTWSPPAALHAYAAGDGDDDYIPRLSVAEDGRFLAAWRSSHVIGGTAGPDLDPLFAIGAARCGDGRRDAGEACDAGSANGAATACCAADCTPVPDGQPCADDDLCTAGDQCRAGTCGAATACGPCAACDAATGACRGAPVPLCVPGSGYTVLTLEDHPGNGRDRVAWRWSDRNRTPAHAVGDPGETGYAFCLYDGPGPAPAVALAAAAPANAACAAAGGAPCWHGLGTPPGRKGYRYRSRTAAPDGVASVQLVPGTRAVVHGAGEHLALPSLPLALPLRAQLRAPDGTCWQATYESARRNDEARVRATATGAP